MTRATGHVRARAGASGCRPSCPWRLFGLGWRHGDDVDRPPGRSPAEAPVRLDRQRQREHGDDERPDDGQPDGVLPEPPGRVAARVTEQVPHRRRGPRQRVQRGDRPQPGGISSGAAKALEIIVTG